MTDWEKRRDEAAEQYGVHIVNNFHSLGTYKQADFKAGFDAGRADALKEAEEQIKVLIKALSKIDTILRPQRFISGLSEHLKWEIYGIAADSIMQVKQMRGEL